MLVRVDEISLAASHADDVIDHFRNMRSSRITARASLDSGYWSTATTAAH